MDAEAYSGISSNLIGILWRIGTSKQKNSNPLWDKARGTAFHSLSNYKVTLFFVPCYVINCYFLVEILFQIFLDFFNKGCFYRSHLFKMLFLISGN